MNMKKIFLMFLILISFGSAGCAEPVKLSDPPKISPPIVEKKIEESAQISCDPSKNIFPISQKYLYVREKGNNNRGPEIDTWLKYCGIPVGNSYCMAYVVYMEHLAAFECGEKDPIPRYARVSLMAKWASSHPERVRLLSTKAMRWSGDFKPGQIALWKNGKPSKTEKYDWNGHTGIIIGYTPDGKMIVTEATTIKPTTKNKLIVREGNTMPGNTGDQSGRTVGSKGPEGGVYDRIRSLGHGTNFSMNYVMEIIRRK